MVLTWFNRNFLLYRLGLISYYGRIETNERRYIMNKQELIALGRSVGLGYVCKEKDSFIFCDGDYSKGFREFIFYIEDLTVENMILCKRLGVSRNKIK